MVYVGRTLLSDAFDSSSEINNNIKFNSAGQECPTHMKRVKRGRASTYFSGLQHQI